MTPSKLLRKYKHRIVKMMSKLRAALEEAGHTCDDVHDISDDTYKWIFQINPGEPGEPNPGGIDIYAEILESEKCDGTKGGVNFSIEAVAHNGLVLGGVIPFNHNDACWVPRKDNAAVEERFRLVEQCDPAEILALLPKFIIQDWTGKRKYPNEFDTFNEGISFLTEDQRKRHPKATDDELSEIIGEFYVVPLED